MLLQRLCGVFITVLLLASAQTAWATTSLFYTFTAEDGHYTFDGGFSVKADLDVVWAVLTDYNHYNRYIANIKAKIIEGKPGQDLLVEQDAGGGFLFIQEHIKARLDVHEVQGQSISFQDVDHKDFALYAGVWTLAPDPTSGEMNVSYVLQAARNKKTPDFLTTDLFGQSVSDLMAEMKKEMERRQAKKEKDIALTPMISPTAVMSPVPTMAPTPTTASASDY